MNGKSFYGKLKRSFQHAFAGVRFVMRTQQNSWVHLLATLIALAIALWLDLPPRDFALLSLAIGMVWAAEMFNTALEALMDVIEPEIHPFIKAAKDAGAGAVLVTAITSVIIGLLVIGPPLYQRVLLP